MLQLQERPQKKSFYQRLAICKQNFTFDRGRYQVRQRIQLLTHQTTLLPPPCNLPIHEIEEQAEGHKGQRSPEVGVCGWGSKTVSHGREDGHNPAKAWQWHISMSSQNHIPLLRLTVELGNQISKMQHLDHREVARISLK